MSDERVPMIGAKSVYGVENQTNELDIQAQQGTSGMTVEEADRWVSRCKVHNKMEYTNIR